MSYGESPSQALDFVFASAELHDISTSLFLQFAKIFLNGSTVISALTIFNLDHMKCCKEL